jgi:pimeloyl-ACP methyl ester carboxylesterase
MLWIAALATAYAALTGVACLAQRPLLFPAPRRGEEPVCAGARLLRIPSPSGEVLALYAPAPEGAPTLVHFHGNGEELADGALLASRFHQAGLGVLTVEYPGYGMAAGAPSERAIYDAAEVALSHLYGELGVPRERVVLEGQSLGSGVATEMAARGHGARVVLLCPFTSIVDMASRLAPFLPARLYVRDRFDNAAKAPRIGVPVLVVHGARDALIPVAQGRRLAGLFPAGRFEEHPDRGHNDLFAVPGSPLVQRIAAFARGEP